MDQEGALFSNEMHNETQVGGVGEEKEKERKTPAAVADNVFSLNDLCTLQGPSKWLCRRVRFVGEMTNCRMVY